MELEFESRPIRPGSLIWSEDNILALLTSSILHIFAPSVGKALGESKAKFLTTSAPSLTLQDDSPPWKLMGDVASLRNAMAPHIEYIMASWSPTGCTRLKGCMLACITSRNSVFIYIPSSSQVDKQWKRYLVLDNHVAAHWGASSVVDLAMADKVETASMAWSPKISLGNIGSLLALGNKAGDIAIWHVTDPNNVCCVKSWKSSSESWIIRLSWSPWTMENDRYVSILSYASADGIVHAHKIRFDSKSPLEDIEVSDNIMRSSIQTFHPCTMMRWSPTITQSITQSNTLAFSRGNRLNVWFPEADKTITWRKPIAKAIADITWDTFGEKIFVFFMDGKHSVLRVQEEELIVDEESVEFIHHEIISRCHVQVRTNIIQDEGEGENANADDEGGDEETSGGVAGSKLQLHIVSGDRSVDGLQLSTLYYVTSPFHMEFQRERFQSCTVVFSKAHKSIQDQLAKTLFDQLDRFIRLPNAALTRNPSYQLWDIGLLIGESAQANESDMKYMNQLLGVLNTKVFQPRQDIDALSKRETLSDPTTTTESRLQTMIYSEPSIAADRASVYLRDMLHNWLGSSTIKNQLEQRAAEGESRIRKHCTKTILKLFSEISSATPNPQPGSELEVQMNACDQTLFLLLCDSILLFHHDDLELVDLAENVYGILQKQLLELCDITEQMSMLQDIKKGIVPTHRSFSFGRETCPACSSEVKLENTIHGTCANGHFWQRCSISLLLIADFHPRMCLGCRRKTLMVPDTESGSTPVPGSQSSSWLKIALQTHGVCCFCGERYYTALRRRGT